MTFARCAVAAALLLLTSLPVLAQNADPKPPSTYDRIWSRLTDWYNDKENPVVQRVLFTGRFQHDLATVEADQGDWRESNIRRVRFGTRITMFQNYLVHAEMEVNPQERNPFYMRITDAYVAWQKNPRSVVMVGKQSIPFTQEGATSSRELMTIDRINLANNLWFTQEYIPGLSISGSVAPWNYRDGEYSAGSKNREFGRVDASVFTLAVMGYDFGKKLGVREAVVTGNYLYQHPDALNTFTKKFEHIGSVNVRLEQPRWGFRSDLSKTKGYLGQRDVLGVMAMPYVNATSKLQFVLRYTFLRSNGNNGLSLASYENKTTRGNGDRYSEGYAGANYLLYGHRLKLQTGVQFADMHDRANDGGAYRGVSWTTGLRVGW
ncbi:MAG: porin [Acidimicrobiia bacterium]